MHCRMIDYLLKAWSNPPPLQPRYVLAEGNLGADYWKMQLSSVFCLATTGTGWGSRFKVRRGEEQGTSGDERWLEGMSGGILNRL